MRKLILIGRVAAGKTTLTQALMGEEIHYDKTQYVNYLDTIIDTPGEYTELRQTSGALALYAYEADVVGLILSANEPYSIFSPCITSLVNREVIGIITGIDKEDANPDRVERWLRLSGCKKVFRVSSYTGEGVHELFEYLREEGDPPLPTAKEKTEKNLSPAKAPVKKESGGEKNDGEKVLPQPETPKKKLPAVGKKPLPKSGKLPSEESKKSAPEMKQTSLEAGKKSIPNAKQTTSEKNKNPAPKPKKAPPQKTSILQSITRRVEKPKEKR